MENESKKKKMPAFIKDALVGLGIGTAVIIPGISGGTIALIFKAFDKIVEAVSGLFKSFKLFWKNLLILLPFGVGAVLAVAGLYYPFQKAFEHCMLAIVCLFVGFILGSYPGVIDNVRGKRPTTPNIVFLIFGFLVSALIGILSVIFDLGNIVNNLFMEPQWYLYLIVFAVGIISSAGLIVPGLSGSLILLVIGFYLPIFNLPKNIIAGNNILANCMLFLTFAIGVAVGFILISKLMNVLMKKHYQTTMYLVIGFVGGSIISIFVNSNMFNYFKLQSNMILDYILSPIFLIVGVVVAYLMVKYVRKHKKEETNNA
ncbi:MAG TPA: hypothetical protein DDW20_04045 [Firmicutes bacterium]|nr:hypothetical protein [Bacillota bacterium]